MNEINHVLKELDRLSNYQAIEEFVIYIHKIRHIAPILDKVLDQYAIKLGKGIVLKENDIAHLNQVNKHLYAIQRLKLEKIILKDSNLKYQDSYTKYFFDFFSINIPGMIYFTIKKSLGIVNLVATVRSNTIDATQSYLFGSFFKFFKNSLTDPIAKIFHYIELLREYVNEKSDNIIISLENSIVNSYELYQAAKAFIYHYTVEPVLYVYQAIKESISGYVIAPMQHAYQAIIAFFYKPLEFDLAALKQFLYDHTIKLVLDISDAVKQYVYDHIIKFILDTFNAVKQYVYDHTIKLVLDTFNAVKQYVYDHTIKLVLDTFDAVKQYVYDHTIKLVLDTFDAVKQYVYDHTIKLVLDTFNATKQYVLDKFEATKQYIYDHTIKLVLNTFDAAKQYVLDKLEATKQYIYDHTVKPMLDAYEATKKLLYDSTIGPIMKLLDSVNDIDLDLPREYIFNNPFSLKTNAYIVCEGIHSGLIKSGYEELYGTSILSKVFYTLIHGVLLRPVFKTFCVIESEAMNGTANIIYAKLFSENQTNATFHTCNITEMHDLKNGVDSYAIPDKCYLNIAHDVCPLATYIPTHSTYEL